MKKRLILLAVLLFLVFSGWLCAEDSEFYVHSVPIAKVYVHNLGYRVVYQKDDLNFGVFYVPNRWLTMTGSGSDAPKAELLTGIDPSFPYFSIFWKNGEFSHIRLYLHRSYYHDSYGDLKDPVSFNDKFDIETLSLEF